MNGKDTSQVLYDTLNRGLADLDTRGLRRRRKTIDGVCSAHMIVDGRKIIGFASNDYLGLAAHESIRAALAEGASLYGAGSGGSHLLGGHCARTRYSKKNSRRSRAVSSTIRARSIFSTGYMANLTVLTALAGRGTLV